MATNNPLTIWIDSAWLSHSSILGLMEQGHTFKGLQTAENLDGVPDLIMSTKAWNWNDSMWPYLEIMLKAARKDKPKGVKKDGKQRKSGNREDRNGTGKVSRRGRKAKLVIGTGNDVPAGEA